jgi:renal tumor antigen
MTDGYYDFKMDLWGYGCILFEMIMKCPLFGGKNELDQVNRIHNVLGTPPAYILEKFKSKASHMEFDFPPKRGSGLEKLMPNVSRDTIDLLYRLLAYDPADRITADEALKHEYFAELHDLSNSRDFRSTLFMKFSESDTMHNEQTP